MIPQAFKATLPFCVFPGDVPHCVTHEFQEAGGPHILWPFQRIGVPPACLHRWQHAVRCDKGNSAMMLAMAQCVDCVECRQSAANHHDAGAAVDIFGPVAKPRHPDERWCISDLLAKWPYGRRIAGGENDS